MIRVALAPVLLALTAAAPPAASPASPAYDRAIAAGYKALTYCSAIFTAGRTPAQIDAEELEGVYPEYDSLIPTLSAEVDRESHTVEVPFDTALLPRSAFWGSRDGCTLLPVDAQSMSLMEDDINADGTSTPPRIGPRRADPRLWPQGDAGIAPHPKPALSGQVAAAFDGASFGAGHTTGVVIVRDGVVVAERYRPGWGPLTANRTWSAAKSITGTLVGLAALDPLKSASIENWSEPSDPRHAITLDNLLRMASGLHSDTAGNRTDAIYFGGTAVDEQGPGWPLEAKPGTRFRYANDDLLLAVRALRTALGEDRYADLPRTALFRHSA